MYAVIEKPNGDVVTTWVSSEASAKAQGTVLSIWYCDN